MRTSMWGKDVPLYSLTQAIKRTMLSVYLYLFFFNLLEFLLSRKKKNSKIESDRKRKEKDAKRRIDVKERANAIAK